MCQKTPTCCKTEVSLKILTLNISCFSFVSRSSVQLFLSGSSVSRSISLGDVDWRLDPGILGLDRETDYTLEYRSVDILNFKGM